MKKYFPDWLRSVHLNPTDEMVNKRIEILNKISSKIEIATIISLVKMLFELLDESSKFPEVFASYFRENDSAFPLRDNEVELRILAGATLGIVIEDNNKNSDIAALAINCCQFSSSELPAQIQDLRALSKTWIEDIALNRRTTIQNIPVSEQETRFKSIYDLRKKIEANEDVSLTDGLEPIIDAFDSMFNLNKGGIGKLKEAVTVIQYLSEEVNVLWWLFGEVSRDLNIPFPKLKKGEDAILFGKELSDLIYDSPGPYSARAILSKALTISQSGALEKISISNSVKDIRPDWGNRVIEEFDINQYGSICPIHCALKCHSGSEENLNWLEKFNQITGIDASLLIESVDLSHQFYNECLILKKQIA